MQTMMLKLDQVRPADWNPPHRSEESYCADLIASFKRAGQAQHPPVEFKQLVPAVVCDNEDGTYTIVEGHRRYVTCKLLGLDFYCTVCTKDQAAIYYAEINSAVKRLDGKDKLHVYLANPKALDPHTAKECDRWGKETLKFASQCGAGVATLKQARTVSNFAGTDPEKTVKWLAKHNLTYTIRRAMEDGTSPKAVATAIKEDRPLIHQGWR